MTLPEASRAVNMPIIVPIGTLLLIERLLMVIDIRLSAGYGLGSEVAVTGVFDIG